MATFSTVNESARPQRTLSSLWSIAFVWALFAAVSFLSSRVPAVNEPHYLCKAQAMEHREWCQRDFFLRSSNAHYCFLWVCGGLTDFMSLTTLAIVGRLASTLALAVGWWRLAGAVFADVGTRARAVFLSSLLFVLLSQLGSFSGEWLLGGFEAKVPAWGFALFATGEIIRGQQHRSFIAFLLAGIYSGLALAVHPVVGGWMAVCLFGMSLSVAICEACQAPIGVADRWASFRNSLLRLAMFSFAFIVFSLPGLVPALRFLTHQTASADDQLRASMIQVFWRLAHHLDPTHLSIRQWLYAAVNLAVVGFVITRLPRGENVRGYRMLTIVLTMSGLIALLGTVIGWHTQSFTDMYARFQDWKLPTTVLKFYPFRTLDGLLPIVASIGITQWASTTLARSGAGDFGESKSRPESALQNPVAMWLIVCSTLMLAWWQGASPPAGYTRAQFADWQKACDWIRKNTTLDSLILTPRESYGFKWFANRAEYVCYKDCPQDAAGILEWNRRLWYLHDWTLKSSGDALYSNEDLRTLREETQCDFVLTRILGPFEAKPLWSSGDWKIYAVPPRE